METRGLGSSSGRFSPARPAGTVRRFLPASSRRDDTNVAQRFSAGNAAEHGSKSGGTTEERPRTCRTDQLEPGGRRIPSEAGCWQRAAVLQSQTILTQQPCFLVGRGAEPSRSGRGTMPFRRGKAMVRRTVFFEEKLP